MVAGKFKSGRFRKVFVRTPGNKTVVQYRKKNPKIARCPQTGQPLLGIPRLLPSKVGSVAKTKRCPSRPYGGNVSSKAMRTMIKQRVIKSNN